MESNNWPLLTQEEDQEVEEARVATIAAVAKHQRVPVGNDEENEIQRQAIIDCDAIYDKKKDTYNKKKREKKSTGCMLDDLSYNQHVDYIPKLPTTPGKYITPKTKREASFGSLDLLENQKKQSKKDKWK